MAHFNFQTILKYSSPHSKQELVKKLSDRYKLLSLLFYFFLSVTDVEDITLELSQLMDIWIYPRIKNNLGTITFLYYV